MEQKLNREEIAKWLIIGFLLIAFAIYGGSAQNSPDEAHRA